MRWILITGEGSWRVTECSTEMGRRVGGEDFLGLGFVDGEVCVSHAF